MPLLKLRAGTNLSHFAKLHWFTAQGLTVDNRANGKGFTSVNIYDIVLVLLRERRTKARPFT